jgi:hypothetical protein
MLCCGLFKSAANAALEIAIETIRLITSIQDKEAASAFALIDGAIRTHPSVAAPGEARLTYNKRFKAKSILNGKERVAERLVYPRCLDTIAADRGTNVVDGLLSAIENKRLEVSVTLVTKAQALAQFKADKPRSDKPDKPNDKPYMTHKNKVLKGVC